MGRNLVGQSSLTLFPGTPLEGVFEQVFVRLRAKSCLRYAGGSWFNFQASSDGGIHGEGC